MVDDEVSSRQQNLEDELRRVKATVSSLDSQIVGLKQNFGWHLTPSETHPLSNTLRSSSGGEACVALWKKLVENGGSLSDTYNELAMNSTIFRTPSSCRGSKKQKTMHRGRARMNRALESPHTGGVKRTRVRSNKEKRNEALWSQCGSILNSLKKHRYAWPFLQPVDPVALNIPDYRDVVKKPIDIGTIAKKLEHDGKRGVHRKYKSPLEFRDDVRLVWSNCRTYNEPGRDVRHMGDVLSDIWEKKWSQSDIETKWMMEQQTMVDDEEGDPFLDYGPKERRRGSNREQKMSFIDKRKLAQQIGSLNNEQVANISELLYSLNFSEEGGEIVVDLEKIDSQTLWMIKHKVEALMTTKVKRTLIQP